MSEPKSMWDQTVEDCVNFATEKQVEYCKGVLKEKNLPESLIYEKRIFKRPFTDREDYFEYWLDDKEFLFAEILRFEWNLKVTPPQLNLVQHMDTKPILYAKPIFK